MPKTFGRVKTNLGECIWRVTSPNGKCSQKCPTMLYSYTIENTSLIQKSNSKFSKTVLHICHVIVLTKKSSMGTSLKVPITPHHPSPPSFFVLFNLFIELGEMSQKFLNLVKIQIFYEFLKLALLRARLSTQENGTSDVISGHCKRRSRDSPVVFCVG